LTPSKLFAALLSLTIISSAGCRPNGDGGQTTPAPQGRASTQPTAAASVAVTNSSPATQGATASEPGMPSTAPANGRADAEACGLLTSEEIQAVQGEGVKATKGTDASTGALAVSQCVYETPSFTNSVSLTLTEKYGDAKGEGPREFWKKNFGGEKGEREEKGRERERGGNGEEEEGLPPTRVRGVGDEAYWVGNGKVGALYVLNGNKFIRVSVGGGDTQEKKLEKTKALAQRALKRV
jgi:hypothetical protein